VTVSRSFSLTPCSDGVNRLRSSQLCQKEGRPRPRPQPGDGAERRSGRGQIHPRPEVRPCLLVNDAERQWREMVPVTVKSNVPLTKSPRQSIVPWPVAPANRPVPPTTVYAPEIRYTPGVAVGQASSSTVQVS
jgi:hypothetical protein